MKLQFLLAIKGKKLIPIADLNKGFFEFRPAFKLVLSGNHKPEIGGVDHGIWRRMRLVPWDVTIADGERKPIAEPGQAIGVATANCVADVHGSV